MQAPPGTQPIHAAPRRRLRVQVVDPLHLCGAWGFAPAGETADFACGRLELLPTGQARWEPPLAARRASRTGLWAIDGTQLVLALDGGTLCVGPVVAMAERLLWGRGSWVRLQRRAPRSSVSAVRPRAIGTRAEARWSLTSTAAMAATSAAALLLAIGNLAGWIL